MPLVEMTVPMEGPRTEAHPKGLSRRPGDRVTVDDAEAGRLVERGMAKRVGDDGQVIHPHAEPPPAAVEAGPLTLVVGIDKAKLDELVASLAGAAAGDLDPDAFAEAFADTFEIRDGASGELVAVGGVKLLDQAERQAQPERAVQSPAKPIERAVTQPAPASPATPGPRKRGQAAKAEG